MRPDRAALEQIKAQGVTRKLCSLTLDDASNVVLGKEPILDREQALGYVTSANYGYTVGQSIVYGYLPLAYAERGTKVEVAYFDERYPATVVGEPPYDPQHLKLKC